MMRTLRIYSLNNFHMQHRAVFINHVAHYIPSTYLSYNWKFVPFDHLQNSLSPTRIYGKHKFYLFFYNLFVF